MTNTQPSQSEKELSLVVALRPTISLTRRQLGGKRVAVLHDDATGKFFHLGAEESLVASLLDGQLTLNDVAQRLNSQGILWSFDELRSFTMALVQADVAFVHAVEGNTQPVPNSRETSPPRSLFQATSAAFGHLLSQRIPLGQADRIAAGCLPLLGRLYSRTGVMVWAAAVIVAFWIAADHAADIIDQCEQMFAPESWVGIACVGILIKAVHELGHAVAAKRQGIRVGAVGITLFMLAPLAYVDLTNAWRLNSRWSRIQIALGGVYLESWLAIFATLLFAWLDDGIARFFTAQVMLIAGPATWLINANPLLRLDGYYALSDATDIPNLRMHGRKSWAGLIDGWLLGKSIAPGHLVGWRRSFATVHAALSVGFQCVWMAGIIAGVWAWTGLLGFMLAVAAIASWVAMPLAAWWLKHWNATPANTVATKLTRRRMLALGTAVGTLVITILTSRNPIAHSIPVVVQHRGEQVGRARTNGFVTAVFVKSNQFVHRGDLLVEVTDEVMLLKRAQMRDELSLQLTKYRQLQNTNKLGEAEAANETVKQLGASLAELDHSLAAANIVAMRDGVIVSEQPERWLGKYAKCGDILVSVAEPNDKELLVAIQEEDYSTYNNAVLRGRPLAAKIRGGSMLSVEPDAAQPRFSHKLPHPAFAASTGGGIPIAPDAESANGIKAAVQVGEAIATISPSQSLFVRAGQRGMLYLDDDRTVFERIKHFMAGTN